MTNLIVICKQDTSEMTPIFNKVFIVILWMIATAVLSVVEKQPLMTETYNKALYPLWI